MQHIRDVAVIGAGPSGLAAIKYLGAEKRFRIQAFEQRDSVGGVWNHNSLTVTDENFVVPRTIPTHDVEQPISAVGRQAGQFISPVYDSLETNIPHTLMNYSDLPFPPGTSLFPRHETVREYLDTYGADVADMISLSTQVLDVKRVAVGNRNCWEVQTINLRSKSTGVALFDAVVVASGHYSDPFIPDIPGLVTFSDAHPGSVSHSKFYKSASTYENMKVIVVGNSASGLDISSQISEISKVPVIVSERAAGSPLANTQNGRIVYKPEISEVEAAHKLVRFSNGDVESDVDHILFCTGYFYSFPFLKTLTHPVVTDGATTHHLYQHLLYRHDPSLVFLGIPQRIVPFPVAEAQAAWISRIWSGRVPLPSPAEMQDWEDETIKTNTEDRTRHVLAFPKDQAYINMLHRQSMAAEERADLGNSGKGKEPPYWGEQKAWVRQRFPLIKLASRKLGSRRQAITTLEELGFDYAAEENKVL